jgi:hypothetical protein
MIWTAFSTALQDNFKFKKSIKGAGKHSIDMAVYKSETTLPVVGPDDFNVPDREASPQIS